VKQQIHAVSDKIFGIVAMGRVWQYFCGSSMRSAVLAGVLVVLAGCATQPPAETDAKKLVADRASARWRAMISKDYDAAYEYLSSGSKVSTSLSQYKGKIKNNIWRDVEVQSVDCEAAACTVKLVITFDYKTFKGVKIELTESWVLENGNAWFVYKG
jgi:hypothetical protein